ncbi:MAG: dienelactone hydrolase family protein [Clostridia bacterium]|nr:dienelactone hydrolase family protein [Clostridia bacterium]
MRVPGQVTDPSSLHTEDLVFESDGDRIDAYLARPRQPGVRPGVIVVHEAFGLVEHIRDIARRLANVGFIALAPNLYARVGSPDPGDMASVLEKMFSLPDAQVVRDLEAAAAFLRAQEGSNGKVGCIGFCSGGRQTLLFACSSNRVDAAIDCWGAFITRATPDALTTPQRPTPVIDLVPQLRCPLLAVFGAEDRNPSPADAETLRARLQGTAKPWTVKVFENAGHAFLADYRPTYREGPAFELWPQIVSFFQTHLR